MNLRGRAASGVVALLCTLALLPTAPASAAGCANQTLQPSDSNVVEIRAATRCLVNRERARFGRKPLASSAALVRAAQGYSDKMVRERFFGHVAPDGSTIMTRVRSLTSYLVGAVRFALGENLAWGSWDLATPLETVDGWMDSTGHRRNILNKRFRHIGIGVASGAPETPDGPAATYTAVFGRRASR